MSSAEPAVRLRTRSAAETRRLGAAIGAALRPGDVVLLTGELGAGKTTLVKGLVAALGGGDVVTSPTFTLCHVYDSAPVVAHVDAWRLGNVGEALELALEEQLDEGAVAVVEWGEALAPLYGADALVVTLAAPAAEPAAPAAAAPAAEPETPAAPAPPAADGGPEERDVVLSGTGPGWRSRLPALGDSVLEALRAGSGS